MASASTHGSTSSVDALDSRIPGAFPASSVSSHQSLYQAVFARRSEYTRLRRIRVKVGSWNVAALKGTEKDVAGWFVEGKGVEEAMAGLDIQGQQAAGADQRESVGDQEARSTHKATTIPENDAGSLPGGEEVGIYALGLQEVVDVGSATEAFKPYTDPAVAQKFKSAMLDALPPGYQLVAEQQLIGLLLLIFVSPSITPEVKFVSTTSVGTGLMGYMGNKGAVTTRLVVGETTRLVFINSHLAAGADKAALERRNWDVSQIISRTKFEPIVDHMGLTQSNGDGVGDEDFAFWFGDLNYRLEGIPGDDVRRLLTVHTQHLDAVKSEPLQTSATEQMDEEVPANLPAHMDPASLHTTISSLLPHDELHQQQRLRKAFEDGWREGPIEFLPTYKYDVGRVGLFDSSEKNRCPSWCDRILYRSRTARLAYEMKVQEEEVARKKDEEMKARGLEEAGADEDLLFDYDPATDGDDYDEFADSEPEVVVTKESFEDDITLEYYTAHQRVLSSDHKPLSAVFALKYDAVVPELRARVHQEVVRDLDRAENEGRPTVMVVVDQHSGYETTEPSDTDSLDHEGIYFGDVRYATSKRRSITIANTGRVPAVVSFVDRPAEPGRPTGPMPPWLLVRFDRDPDKNPTAPSEHDQYTIEPAEVCNVELKLKVELIELVRELNEGVATLDDVLVLRVENGRDHFLPVRGRWLSSSFGRSIDKLIRIPEGGIRKLQRQKPSATDQAVKWSAPRELFRLTESIEDLVERTLAEWDMTSSEGDKPPWQNNAGWPFAEESWGATTSASRVSLRANVYEALDCDQPFDTAFTADVLPMERLEVLAQTLLVFLWGLQDGIITEELWVQLESSIAAREKAKQQLALDDERMWCLEILSSAPTHNVSFVLLTSMLSRVASEIVNSTSSSARPMSAPRSSVELPASPRVTVRRKTLSQIPEVARRQLINRNYAVIFSGVMIRAPQFGKGKEKEKRTREERMTNFIEMFLRESEEGR
ncbi:DNase I-like protein [Mytilinidion resinicola]|uniref:DNase I-like protein n=1 Tax=Mytilinidion resinicola TaxID=574789 RepID=A0A6A6YT04_9PEZI|nr:DNase I-like protein [Mytilinidion resinicola]KAF2811095.1 DNase I-like protein [Mytilinidion resinicola]